MSSLGKYQRVSGPRGLLTTSCVLGVLLCHVGLAEAATVELYPGASFETAVEGLSPGDTLIVHEGTYSDTGRISIGVRGTAAEPVVITGAPGEARPLITRAPSAAVQNTINVGGATHLTIRGLEITGNGGDGVNLSGGPSFITLEDLVIHNVDVGINLRSDMHHIVIRDNHIYDTGANGSTGEGMYVGCNYANCVVSDALIERNWIHDTMRATQGDGIEIKRGSHSNVIRDNVIHDTRYPCILLYGTDGNPRNLVEGNAMWNCGDSGIQAAADAVIRNNLILDSPSNGFNSQDHQGVTPNNLEFTHNTLVGGSTCLRLYSWGGKQGMVFANNAVYCPGGSFAVSGLAGVQIEGNVVYPQISQFPSSAYTVGRAPSVDMIDPSSRNVYPAPESTLIDAGAAGFAASVDFNGTSRSGSPEAGAYAWTGPTNPGWTVAPGFKPSTVGADVPPAPPANLRVDPD